MIETSCWRCGRALSIETITCGECCAVSAQVAVELAETKETLSMLRDERDRLLPLARFAALRLPGVSPYHDLYARDRQSWDAIKASGVAVPGCDGGYAYAPGLCELMEKLRRG